MLATFIHRFLRPNNPVTALEVGDRTVPVLFVRHPRARRYILRLHPDGRAQVTIPRGGSAGEALRFAAKNQTWLAQALQRQSARPSAPARWSIGSAVFFRGVRETIAAGPEHKSAHVRLRGEMIEIADLAGDLRPDLERHLRRLAETELPARVADLAHRHQLVVRRITVRNQKSRWGSCSRRGTISLNWRLIQTPDFVRDYIILHELMHLRQMNHSARFWHEVQTVCPEYQTAERWLKQHAQLLR